jgi:hypothetical protein
MRARGRLGKALALAGMGLAGLAGIGGLSSCGDDTTYSYFAVDVALNDMADADFLARIASCGVNVEGADSDFAPIASCQPGAIRDRKLGTVEYSTAESSGSVRFKVTVKDIAGMTLAEGTSSDVPITSGSVTRASVTVVPLPAALMPRPTQM